ncbi:dihydrofolate reductase-like domain-containing protein, partial [Tricladium varicosporioides]
LPHVTLTYAQSIDGQIALSSGGQTALSGPETKAMTHYLRSQHDAILIGKNTAEVDNPSLNCRFSYNGSHVVDLAHQPKPIILDPSKRWREDMSNKVFYLAKKGLGRGPIWVTSQNDPSLSQFRNEALLPEESNRIGRCEEVGGYYIQAGGYDGPVDGVNWQEILIHLSLNGIRSVMIEGGAAVINDLLRDRNQRFIDSVIVTIAPIYLGTGGPIVSPPRTLSDSKEATLKRVQWLPYGQDVVLVSRLN